MDAVLINKNTPLMDAVLSSPYEMFEIILNGADVNAINNIGQTALDFAIDRYRKNYFYAIDIVLYLIEKGATYNEKQLIDIGINRAKIEKALKARTREKTDININTQLLNACYTPCYNDFDINKIISLVKHLIKKGADIYTVNRGGRTPLYLAIIAANYDLIEILFKDKTFEEIGVYVNKPDNNGITPLMIAAKYSPTNILQLLIIRGANVDAEDNRGDTALVFAMNNNNITDILYLIEEGATYDEHTEAQIGGMVPKDLLDQALENRKNLQSKQHVKRAKKDSGYKKRSKKKTMLKRSKRKRKRSRKRKSKSKRS